MRYLCARLGLVVLLLIASSASAVSMAWTAIGNPRNPGNYTVVMGDGTTGYGSVPYTYSIGTYDVTNTQYAEFLNAKAKSDPLRLYSTNMSDPSTTDGLGWGGITRSGTSGSYTYTPIAGRENMPVNWVTFFDGLRFANWMNNGQGSADTETGSYTLLGGTPTPINETTVTRNAGATIVLTSENEWYKAAYYDPSSSSYFAYATASNTSPTCAMPTATPNRANCGDAVHDFTPVGSYTGSKSPYGTFDQSGNAWQWNESIDYYNTYLRGTSGGGWNDAPYSSGVRAVNCAYCGQNWSQTFRLVMIPEPGTGLLVVAGLLGLAGWRQARA